MKIKGGKCSGTLWERYYKMMQDGDISGVDVMKILDLKKTTFYKLINQYEEGK